MTKYYRNLKGGYNKRIPQIPSYFFSVIWYVLYMLIAISLYIYFNGNCFFDRHRIFREDDELDNPNYEKGLIVLILAIIDAFMNKTWPWVFFRLKKYGLSLIMIAIMLMLHGVILWAMATTDQCRRDDFENRYWVSFALYLLYTIWLVIAFIINARWFSIFGFGLNKKCPHVKAANNGYWIQRRKKKHCTRKSDEQCVEFMKACSYPGFSEPVNTCSSPSQYDAYATNAYATNGFNMSLN